MNKIKQKFIRPNGHSQCRTSTGIHECLTFGSGRLDEYGFWENGCFECARSWEEQFPEDGPCWPHTKEQISKLFH